MSNGIHYYSSRNLTNALYVCRSCRAKLNVRPAAAQRPQDRYQNQHQQRRWISRNHLTRIKSAEEEWAIRADAIKAGEKKSILDLLEERGYVNQIVGCV